MDSIYLSCILTRKITIPITMVDSNLEHTLHRTILKELAGKCIPEGFVKPNSIRLITYTCGTVNGNMVVFTCVFNCDVANPVEGHILKCVVENVTKAGLKCKLDIQGVSPCVVFVARDHHYMDEEFNKNIGDKITVKVIGQRFELNDKFISIIGSLINETEKHEPDVEEIPNTDEPEPPKETPSEDEPPKETPKKSKTPKSKSVSPKETPKKSKPPSKSPKETPKKSKKKIRDKPLEEGEIDEGEIDE